jgi:hypothetical protein
MASRARICSTFTNLSFRSLYHLAVTRIEITAAACAALAASAARGLVEPLRSPEGGYFIWLAPKALKRLMAAQTPFGARLHLPASVRRAGSVKSKTLSTNAGQAQRATGGPKAECGTKGLSRCRFPYPTNALAIRGVEDSQVSAISWRSSPSQGSYRRHRSTEVR